jgi:hypothetical protein
MFLEQVQRCQLCRPEPSSDRAVLFTAVRSVGEFRYQVVWSAVSKYSNVKGHLHKVGIDEFGGLSGNKEY